MTIKKTQLNFIVDAIENVNGWLKIIWQVFGNQAEDYCSQYVDEKKRIIQEAEKFYKNIEIPKIKTLIKKFREENRDFEKECELRRGQDLKKEYQDTVNKLELLMEQTGRLEEKEELLKKAEIMEKIIYSKINRSMIERAKEFPIANFLEVGKNGRVRCPLHNGKDYNMDIRKNYGYCYVCGESGDAIKLYQKLNNVSFREAVIKLQ